MRLRTSLDPRARLCREVRMPRISRSSVVAEVSSAADVVSIHHGDRRVIARAKATRPTRTMKPERVTAMIKSDPLVDRGVPAVSSATGQGGQGRRRGPPKNSERDGEDGQVTTEGEGDEQQGGGGGERRFQSRRRGQGRYYRGGYRGPRRNRSSEGQTSGTDTEANKENEGEGGNARPPRRFRRRPNGQPRRRSGNSAGDAGDEGDSKKPDNVETVNGTGDVAAN